MTPFDPRVALRHVARVFGENRQDILDRWRECVLSEVATDDELEYQHLYEAIMVTLDNFIFYMEDADVTGYHDANAAVGAQLAYNDVSYQAVFDAYHFYQSAYLELIAPGLDVRGLLETIRVLDQLNHQTISTIMDQYFQVGDSTAFAIAKLVEMRDYETGSHLERTRDISVMIAKAMQLDRGFIEQLYRVGPLHDLGKIGVSDSILLKPSRLTDEEYGVMKRHTTIGGDVISSIIGSRQINRGYLLMAIEVALYHHERYDGKGYPDGLSGQLIPLSARIFCVADTYDAITNDRPYQTARSHEEAVRIIRKEAGHQFDPQIVQAFLGMADQVKEEMMKYRDSNKQT